MYILYQLIVAIVRPESSPPIPIDPDAKHGLGRQVMHALVPPIVLIVSVLGSILMGIATPTEAAAVGAVGAALLAGIRVKELDMDMVVLNENPNSEQYISRMFAAIFGGFLIFALLGEMVVGDPWTVGIIGMIATAAFVHFRAFRKLLIALDNQTNTPIYLAALALLLMLVLSYNVDMRIQRDTMTTGEYASIGIAILAGLIVVWGLAVALWLSLIHISEPTRPY